MKYLKNKIDKKSYNIFNNILLERFIQNRFSEIPSR